MFSLILVSIVGLCFGSFLNVLIHRLPINQSIIFPGSYCTHCHKSIPWFHNIPLLSYLFLRARSSCCNQWISIQYPLIEFLSLLLWLWSFSYIDSVNERAIFLIISSILIVIALSDLHHYIIPIELNIILFSILILNYFLNGIDNYYYHLLSGMFLAMMFLLLMLITNYIIKKQSMGYGDIILIGFIGMWLGLFKGLAVIFFGSVISLVHWIFLSKKQDSQIMIPFGFSLSICAIATYIIYRVCCTY